jgi:hypothetical protein
MNENNVTRLHKFEAVLDNLSWEEIISVIDIDKFEEVKELIFESLTDEQLDELYYVGE